MKRIGIIGVGGIANGVHIPQLLNVRDCKITAVCDIDPIALENTAKRLEIDKQHQFKNYKALIDCSDIDAVEICTPNYVHVKIAEYAALAGKSVNIEKPLGITAKECEKLKKIVKEKNIVNMMSFSYRFFPAVRYAKWIIDKGLIGKIVSLNVEYLKSSAFCEGRRLDWRFVKKYAGTGVLGDLGVHLIDMAQLLVGDFTGVSGMIDTVVKQRMKLDSDEMADVETDDYCNFIANIKNRNTGENSAAAFSITRCAIGHNNTIKYDIFGTEGVISFNLNNPKVLGVCIGEVDKKSFGLHTVNVPGEFSITQEQAFVDALNGKFCDYFPTVEDGIKCQKIVDAVLKSAEKKTFVQI
ncbi:MAG: Gfo/Idh/MocA family oxidoreductase [Clostridia bacterium]|nr:Gfo/Idh/MocA family oxidoreductase [Clostridia bacterium]